MLKLCLVRHDHQSNLRISLLCHAVDQFGQAMILALWEVDHRVSPRRCATELEREPRLAHTRRPLDMQVIHTACVESEIDSSFRQVRLYFRGRLIGHPVFIAACPFVQRQQPQRSSRLAGGNGRMLITPLRDLFAAVNGHSLCSFRG